MNKWNDFWYDLLYYLSIVLRELALYIELNYYIKRNKTFIKYTSSFEKNIGKSFTLVKTSIKHNIPIIVNTEKQKQKLLELKEKYMKKTEETLQILLFEEVNSNYSILLIDEGLTMEEVNQLKTYCDVIVGYVCISDTEEEL